MEDDALSAGEPPVPVTVPIDLAPGVVARFTTRLGGASTGDWAYCNMGSKVGDDPTHVAANMRGLEHLLGERVRLIHQVHSAIAIDADEMTDRGIDTYTVDADAQASARPGVPLGIFGADCLPVLYADPASGVIAASHCGRRGLQRGVVASCVAQMVKMGAEPKEIRVTLGPCICGDCYEVGDAIAAEFAEQFPGTATRTRFGGAGIDIAAAARIALAAQGIDESRIVDAERRAAAATKYLEDDEELRELCANDNEGDPDLAERIGAVVHPLCTLENPLWYSHRRAHLSGKPHEGRFLAIVAREA